jgi:D-alanyl-D-alanine carboxypeptidase (penicillin-binding protein 5/6)
MFVEAGRKVPFGELFKGVAVVSGNDAAVAIAEYLAGSTDAFVQKMNQKAASLGMTNTHYRSVNGLPEGDLDDLSTPRDLGKLATSYIQKYPGNLAIHSLKEFAFDTGHGVIKQQSENPLLGTYPGADGLKTGYIDNTYNLIGTAQRDGVRLVLVTMKAPTASDRAKDAKTLMDYGFAQYGKYTLSKKGYKVNTIPVYKAKSIKKTDVFVKDDAKVIVHSSELKGKTIKKVIKLPEYLNATNGFKAGDKVGEVQYYIGKKLIAHEDLVVHDNIEKGTWWQKGIDSLIIFGGWVIGLFRR